MIDLKRLFLGSLLFLGLLFLSTYSYGSEMPEDWQGFSLSEQWELLTIAQEQRTQLRDSVILLERYENQVIELRSELTTLSLQLNELTAESQNLNSLTLKAENYAIELNQQITGLTNSLAISRILNIGLGITTGIFLLTTIF